MKYYKVPGLSIAIINDGKIEWEKAYNVTSKNKVTTKTLFQAGSISKSISAVVALSLVEKNQVNLDQNVNNFLRIWQVPDNEYTETEKVTLRRLLSHTAGMTVHGFEGYSSSLGKKALPTIIQTLNGEKPANNSLIEPNNIPGKGFSYSGGGYIVAQKILEDITQDNFYILANEIVFNPLKMRSSTYELIWPVNPSDDIAVGHSEDGKVIPGKWNLLPESTAAGLWTTPDDLARFVIDIQNTISGKSSKILSNSMTHQILTKQPSSETGLGFFLNQINSSIIEFSHGGVNVGYVAYFIGFTEIGKGAVIMTNSDNGGMVISEIIRSIADTYHWPEGYTQQYKIVQPVTIDPTIYQNYVGQFEINGSAPSDSPEIFTLSTKKNKFFITLHFPTPSSKNTTFELTPESEMKFFTEDGGFEIEFTPGNNNEFLIFDAKAHRIDKPIF
jgi:CubicO group peptidase (beta-lactamase class C family)